MSKKKTKHEQTCYTCTPDKKLVGWLEENLIGLGIEYIYQDGQILAWLSEADLDAVPWEQYGIVWASKI